MGLHEAPIGKHYAEHRPPAAIRRPAEESSPDRTCMERTGEELGRLPWSQSASEHATVLRVRRSGEGASVRVANRRRADAVEVGWGIDRPQAAEGIVNRHP
jgi:hypothetical protein